MQRPASRPPRPSRALERRVHETAQRALKEDGCERVLIVYEPRDASRRPEVRVYGEDSNGAPQKLEVLR